MAETPTITRRELLVLRAHGLDGELTELRVRRIRRLRRDLGLSYDVIALVLPLVERVEELEIQAVKGR
ncbi:MAG TPA: hypothetical protein VN193_05040 [Candidatus Angelobacter sp.]|nr:hypothetical protein [Candidatus Angelobacter sp.]